MLNYLLALVKKYNTFFLIRMYVWDSCTMWCSTAVTYTKVKYGMQKPIGGRMLVLARDTSNTGT